MYSTYVLYVNLSQSLSIYKAQQILLGMSMPCDAIEQAEIGAVLPCYTMLYLSLPYSTP